MGGSNVSRVKELRESANIEQKFMAELICVSRSSYSKKESGQVGFALEEAKKIADFFGKSIEEIFFDSEVSNGDGTLATFSAICSLDENRNPILSEREKMMEATAEEITQLLKGRNLTVGEARSVLNYVERAISRTVEEMLF